ncbi:MAG: hypothetical protein E7316_04470 [Clostridiales bacterium]|nr:hypothetical protein [Clostridiales bacterium]
MKRVTRETLQAMYPPMPEDFAARALSGLPRGEEKIIVKRKVSAALVLAAMLVLLAVGSVAAALNWDAILFLYGKEEPQLSDLMSPVNRKGEAGGVSLEITSAVTDGRALAFDWTLQVDETVLPVYLQVDEIRMNEWEQFFLDTVAGLNRVWIGPDEKTVHSGELLQLPEPVQAGENIHVELTLGIYKPKREVTLFFSPRDQQEAQALRSQGVWAVAPVNEVPSMRRAGELSPLWRYDTLSEKEKADYDRSEITLVFDVMVTETDAQELVPDQDAYEMPGATFRVVQAYRTPLSLCARIDLVIEGVETEAEAMRQSRYYSFSFRDARGEYLYGQSFTGAMAPTCYYWKDDELHMVQEVWTEAYDNTVIAEDEYLCLTYSHGRDDGKDRIMLTRIGEVRLRMEE